MTDDKARKIALSFPEAVEKDHHGRPSFRVSNKIFATLWTDTQMNVMAPRARIEAAAADHPDCCEELYWGGKLAAIKVDLTEIDAGLLEDLLELAWADKAPKRLQQDDG